MEELNNLEDVRYFLDKSEEATESLDKFRSLNLASMLLNGILIYYKERSIKNG